MTAPRRSFMVSTGGAIDLTPLETRSDIESLEALQHERRVKRARLDRLEALHGSFGLAEAYRKQLRAAIKVELRDRAISSGIKLTDDAAEDRAEADPRYKKVLEDHINEKTECLRLKNEVTEIEERIRNRDLCLQAYTREITLR